MTVSINRSRIQQEAFSRSDQMILVIGTGAEYKKTDSFLVTIVTCKVIIVTISSAVTAECRRW
jgi:hypothetical protein